MAVKDYLVEHHKISRSRIVIRGAADSNPIADNHTRDGRNANRRAEIRLQLETIPEFPWPPPKPSAFCEIPSSFLQGQETWTSLRQISDRIKGAFDRAGYVERTWYSVPGGFSIVSRIEQINLNGTPVPHPHRWALAAQPPTGLGVFWELFRARQGYYRLIIFVVSDQPFNADGPEITAEKAMELLRQGSVMFPSQYDSLEFTRNHRCTALVYEFEQPSPDSKAMFRNLGLTARTHLERSNLWAALERH